MTPLERLRGRLFVGFGLLTRAMTLGVRCMVIDERADGPHVLLVRHSYVGGLHLPGGGVERGESVWDAVEKEVREETHVRLRRPPALHGFYRNARTSRFDHVALFVARDWTVPAPFRPTREITECAFHPAHALPADTTAATRDRVAEVLHGRATASDW